jgi:type II secretory pathway component PulJ
MIRRPRRPGFTLLEIILALGIGLVLMFALFVMLNSQLSHSQAGRESIQEATLARAILTRISNDVAGSLGPYDPRQATEAASGSDQEASAVTTTTETGTFNVGIQGDTKRLLLAVGRVPRELLGPEKLRADVSALPKVSDLRRITYWVVEGQGLARQEVTRVTSEELDEIPPDVNDPGKYIIAPEVKSISFQYWDVESSWVGDWDGSVPGVDGDTPIGPPAAIEIVIELDRGKDREPGRYRHVISVPTGNNYSLQQTQ